MDALPDIKVLHLGFTMLSKKVFPSTGDKVIIPHRRSETAES